MSQEIHIVRTRFETLDDQGNAFYTTYGARIYDDMECGYANTLDTLVELMALDPGDLVDYISDNNETAKYMLQIASDCDIRVYVDDELYSGGSDDGEELCAELPVEVENQSHQAAALEDSTATQQ